MKTKYECTNCGAVTYDRGTGGGNAPVALNCHKCHAGSGMDLNQMVAQRVGMMPTETFEYAIAQDPSKVVH